MPLPPPAPRQALHRRNITCEGFQRDDGLWDIEAHMVDTRDYELHLETNAHLPPGAALHEMWLRVTMSTNGTIEAVAVAMDATPYQVCANIESSYQQLVGLVIGPGWRKRLRQKVAGTQGCTHLTELLGTIATVAFQTIAPKMSKEAAVDPTKLPPHLNACHALKLTGETVKQNYPKWYRPESADDE